MNYFNEYIQKYDMNNPSLKYKYYHSHRVMNNMESLARNMNLPAKDITLAKCIGLVHDIGRFDEYASNHDKMFDHGDYGVKVLKENNILEEFDIAKDDYNVVYKAVKNHNKYAIESNLTNRQLLFTKMIRDADKLDILYALGNKELKEIVYEDDSKISENINSDFYKKILLKRTKDTTTNDNLIILFSFIYDINFISSLSIISKNNYYGKIYHRLKNRKKFKPYIEYVNNYLNERIDENAR